MRSCLPGSLAVWLVVISSVQAASVNAVRDGDFEDNTYVKQDNLGMTGLRPWQFNVYPPEIAASLGRANDLGYWIGSTAGSGSGGGYTGLAISTWDDPRAEYAANGTTITSGGMGAQNVSKDPNSDNNYLDSVAFRKGVGQIFAAPASTALGGQGTISFDYVFADWTTDPNDDPIRLHARLFGLPTLPTFVDLALWDGGGDLNQIEGEVLLGESTNFFNWGSVSDPNVSRAYDATPIWHSFDRTFVYDIPPVVGDEFLYYYLRIDMIPYSEANESWGLEGGRPVDSLSIALDNVDIRVALLGDVNRDGSVNALDISPFIVLLTTGGYQGEADINKDRAINALDISGCVSCLTGGACGSGAAAVPEPSVIGLLAVGALALLSRR